MSNRFLRWVEAWIEENIPPGANPDIESHEARAKRLSEKLFAEATEAGFTSFETEEERERVSPLVLPRSRTAPTSTSMPTISSRNWRGRMRMATEPRMKDSSGDA